MKQITLIAFCISCSLITAQNWISPGGGLNYNVRSFYIDSTDNALLVTGQFSMAGTVTSKSIAAYNGNLWDSLSSYLITPGQDVWAVTRYNGNIYAAGPFFGGWQQYFCRWNGTYWDSIAYLGTNIVSGFCTYNNELIMYGSFDSIPGKISSNKIVKWDGTNWNSFDTTRWYGSTIGDVAIYQGELYAVGNFTNYNQSISEIARWDGVTWHPVGGGFYGGFCHINSTAVYNNELYVGGLFSSSDGNPGNCIAKWNGTTWSDVGGGMGGNAYPQVTSFAVKDGYLYAGGVFSTAGGINAERFARWDGTNWCGFGDVFGNSTIWQMAVYNNEIYIGTGLTINGDTIRYIGKWTEPSPNTCGNTTSINENKTDPFQVSFYPNPATSSGTFRLNGNHDAVTVTVYDPAGRIIWKKESRENEIHFPAGDFASGLYYYRVSENGMKKVAGKFIIE